MERKIKHYKGMEINKRVIRKVRQIVASRGEECSYNILNDGVDFSVKDLSHWDRALVEQEHLVLGQDWFIMYIKRRREIEITDWVSVPTVEDKFVQTKEMLHVMKSILIEGKDAFIKASMKFDTSYRFFRTLLEHGYVEERYNYIDVFDNGPDELQEWVDSVVSITQTLPESIELDMLKENPEYKKYLYHDVCFGVTEKFVKRYYKGCCKNS